MKEGEGRKEGRKERYIVKTRAKASRKEER